MAELIPEAPAGSRPYVPGQRMGKRWKLLGAQLERVMRQKGYRPGADIRRFFDAVKAHVPAVGQAAPEPEPDTEAKAEAMAKAKAKAEAEAEAKKRKKADRA